MAVETLTIYLEENGDIKGKDIVDGDEDDNQIVTFLPDDDDMEGGLYTISFFGKGSPTETGAGPGGDDVFHMDLSLFQDNFRFQVKSMDAGDIFDITGWDSVVQSGSVYIFTYTGADNQEHTFRINAQSQNGDTGVDVVQVTSGGVDVMLMCFGRDTLIDTENGERPIQDLREGDLVRCGDGHLRPICWVGSRRLGPEDFARHPEWRPIRFKADALGKGMPAHDLTLSPQHGVLLQDWRAELLFGAAEVFVPAKHLTNDLTIRQDHDCEEVEYFHILLEDHQSVSANGLECETLFIDALQSGALSSDARDEICGIFPELVSDLGEFGQSYRQTLRRFESQALMNAPLFGDS